MLDKFLKIVSESDPYMSIIKACVQASPLGFCKET